MYLKNVDNAKNPPRVLLNLALMVIDSYVFPFITLSVGNKMLGCFASGK